MKKAFYLLMFVFSMVMTSCSATQQTVKCAINKVIEEDLQSFQEGYTLKIPSNWVSYKDIHCNLTHAPEEMKEKKGTGFEWVRVFVYHSTDKSYYQKFKGINDFVMHSVNRINRIFNKPRIDMTTLKHPKYGEYRVLSYNLVFLGNRYVKSEVYFFYKGQGYIINYSAKIDQFDTYLLDFQKMVAFFEIKV